MDDIEWFELSRKFCNLGYNINKCRKIMWLLYGKSHRLSKLFELDNDFITIAGGLDMILCRSYPIHVYTTPV